MARICHRGRPPDTVAELRASWVTSPRSAPLPGYVCVISKRHANEPFELPAGARAEFWEDTNRVAAALNAALAPAKINYEIHGNTIPHLHLHVFPRYAGDPFEGRPIDGGRRVERTAAELDALRQALAPLEHG